MQQHGILIHNPDLQSFQRLIARHQKQIDNQEISCKQEVDLQFEEL